MPDLLSRVLRATTSTTDTAVVLARVAQLLTRRADWVIADRLDDPDLITRVGAFTAHGPMTLPPGAGAGAGGGARRSTAQALGLLPLAVTAPRHCLRLDHRALSALAGGDDEHRAAQASAALAFGARELVVLALVARDHVLGVLALGSRTGFEDAEVDEIVDVGLHVATALDAGRLLAVQRAVATALQTSLLPALPTVPGLRLAARYAPAGRGLEVGGDWYDAFATRAGLVVVVGDASGHDVTAATRMADLRNILRAHAVDRHERPGDLVGRLERTADQLGLDATGTCVVARVSPRPQGAQQVTWTSAGHLPPVLVHDGVATLLETRPDLMLGVALGSARADHDLLLHPGDVLLLCTDGLVEVRDASLDERLELLRRTAEALAGADPDVLVDLLLTAMVTDATDDIALLALRVDPVAATPRSLDGPG